MRVINREYDNYERLENPINSIFVLKTQFTTNIIKNSFIFTERFGGSFHGP